MCRWLAYVGKPIAPERYLYEEQFSLIEQSQNARKSKSTVNGDGFGLGWYGNRSEPGVFRDVLPAWSDENLRSIAGQITSGLFMAHVRAATDTPSNRTNCHPFRHDRSLFMHNGQIGGYLIVRRDIENLIPDELYRHRLGTTDSEAMFLYLKSLLEVHPFHEAVGVLIRSVRRVLDDHDVGEPFRFTSAYADGENLYAVRYSTDDRVPSLFFKRADDGCLLVSEPLNGDTDHWTQVPENHSLELTSDCSKPMMYAIG